MACHRVRGGRRRKVVKTAVLADKALCPQDLMNRQCHAGRLNHLLVANFTDVSTWQGWLCVAFLLDVFTCRIAS
jgi:hypothetical protein